MRTFVDVEPALAWLSVVYDAGVMDALAGVVAGTASNFLLASRLHVYLERNLSGSLQGAARALGISSRTLQRRLRDERTSFQREHCSTRVRIAKDLMVHTDFDLKRIALEVGCAWQQQFSAMFHKHVGETPTAWRERARRAWPSGLAG